MLLVINSLNNILRVKFSRMEIDLWNLWKISSSSKNLLYGKCCRFHGDLTVCQISANIHLIFLLISVHFIGTQVNPKLKSQNPFQVAICEIRPSLKHYCVHVVGMYWYLLIMMRTYPSLVQYMIKPSTEE